MVTTKQTPIVNSQKIKRRESKHIITENYQFTRKVVNEDERTGNYKTARQTKFVALHFPISNYNTKL